MPTLVHFTDPSNPILPYEFSHCSPGEYTTQFDVWQFGVLLMDLISGLLPLSYGTEPLQHIANVSFGQNRVEQKSHKDISNGLPLHLRFNFFYD
jgi:hypothetical protein